jgi:hypothetical protein
MRTPYISVLVCLATITVPLPVLSQENGIFREAVDSGLDFVHFNGMTGQFYMPEINSGGGGFVDYDNDGDLDIYLVQGNLLGPEGADPVHRDRLFRNDLQLRPDGSRLLRFTDVTERAGIRAIDYGMGVAAGDYDQDGWPDLYITNLGSNRLLHNEGDGTFSDVTEASGTDDKRWSVPASWADYDGDGYLDLFVGNYVDFTLDNHKICRTSTGAQDYCGPTAFPSLPDRLFRNNGDGTFRDVAGPTGIQSQLNKTLGAVAADFNGDGRMDYYVASDRTANQLWIQGEDGNFTDDALLAGCAVNSHGKPEASMGVDAADVDGDGDVDLFMTHLIRETNTLYLNDGTGLFEDVTIQAGLGPPSWEYTSWGTAWFDYDNDGLLEMMTANGDVRVIEEQANAGDPYPFRQPNLLFHGLGDARFEDVTDQAGGVFKLSEVSRAVGAGDIDNDGDADLLLVNNNGPARLLINQVGQGSHWLGLRLMGRNGWDQLGTRVELIRPDGASTWRRVRTDGSFATSNDPRVLFGLGADPQVAAVRVHWSDGAIETWRQLTVDTYMTLRRGTGRISG